MTGRIRPLTASDEAEWRCLWRDYLAFYDTEVSEAVYQSSFARLLGTDPQDFSGLIAVENGKAVGLAHYLFHRHGWKVENVCYLQDLYTLPEARGQGVGRDLIQAVYAAADQAGARDVYWMTQDFNVTARKLYDRVAMRTPFIKYARPQ